MKNEKKYIIRAWVRKWNIHEDFIYEIVFPTLTDAKKALKSTVGCIDCFWDYHNSPLTMEQGYIVKIYFEIIAVSTKKYSYEIKFKKKKNEKYAYTLDSTKK